MQNEPLISCLCVTRHKPELLKRAIQCFRAQTYDHKELIILYETDDKATAQVLSSIQDPNIHCVEVGIRPKLTLGALRNLSIERCQGDYFCQWDDDDWYHPRRLEIQLNAIHQSDKPASGLTHWLMFDSLTGKAFCSHHRVWEGSIMCQTSIARMHVRYPDFNQGEDSPFIHNLYTAYGICHLPLPTLYIYNYNGLNTWDYDHFSGLFAKGRRLPRYASLCVEHIMRNTFPIDEAAELLDDEEFLSELETRLGKAASLPKPQNIDLFPKAVAKSDLLL